MLIGEALFRQDDLDRYLRGADIEGLVRSRVIRELLEKTDVEIARQLLPELEIKPLQVDFDHPEKDAVPATVEVEDRLFGRATIEGVRATRSYPFTGNAELWNYRTNPWVSALPRGEIRGDRVVIGLEGRSDAEVIKQELDRQENLLREYVEYSRAQVDKHNVKLEGVLAEAIARRRKYLEGIDSLRDKI